MELIARNVHEALPRAVQELIAHGKPRMVRGNKPVLVFPEQVTTVFLYPWERVLFYRERDANPFLHFFESLWMLAGRNDVAFLVRFVERFKEFSDDGEIYNGAYGYRWRRYFTKDRNASPSIHIDQLEIIAQMLRVNPDERRCVLAMWDGNNDLGLDSKDIPCNLNCKFNIRPDGKLHMTVDNRSNDIVWGLYGANAVHFSFLLEYMAAKIGVPIGHQVHLSNDFHGYLNTIDPLRDMQETPSPYREGVVSSYPIMMGTNCQKWDQDLKDFFECVDDVAIGQPHLRMPLRWTDVHFNTPFFNDVVSPMWQAHAAFKEQKGEQRYTEALANADVIAAPDWRWAARDWLETRHRRWQHKADAGALS